MVIITEKTLKKLVKEFLITIGFLSIATVIGMLLIYIGFTESNVTMVYLLCVLLISIFTNGYIWSVAGSLVSVVLSGRNSSEQHLQANPPHSRYIH